MTASVLDRDVVGELQSVMGSDFRTLVESFFRDSEQRLTLLQEVIERGDAEELRQTAHSFKGSSGNLGALALSGLCLELEQAGRAGQLDQAPELLERIRQAYDEARRELEQYIETDA
jgi:HPt (histidine-containing phosphotransfer) domain-containing protein